MKQRNSIVAIAGLLLSLASQTWAANTKQTVTQVSATVELTANVDYFVSSATPFGEAGVVNIVNTDHAVLILSNVKPSEAIPMLAAHVQINGAKAVNNTNCQVKLYNRGSIILPYGNSTKPLTVYSEQNFGGESCNNFGLENSGGYMNTLSEAKLNNKIRSFKLKRGYMVTFSNLPNGRGYSRCFIAAYNDTWPATRARKRWQPSTYRAATTGVRVTPVCCPTTNGCPTTSMRTGPHHRLSAVPPGRPIPRPTTSPSTVPTTVPRT